MLTIRQDQMDSFEAVLLESFITKLMEHLDKKFPDEVKEIKKDFRLDCKEGVEKARSYGIGAKEGIMSYMEIRLQCGSDFDQKPWAHNILTDSSLFPSEKILVLEEASMISLIDEPS